MAETTGDTLVDATGKERGRTSEWFPGHAASETNGQAVTRPTNRKLEKAGRHLAILGLLICLALAGAVVAFAYAESPTVGGLLESGGALAWVAVFAVALTGSLLNRMVAVSFTGFKYKRYDALAFPHELVIALRAPFVAVALLALGGASIPQVGDAGPVAVAAGAFGLGYFSDLAFERFRDMVRTMLGKEVDSDEPERPLVDGVDVPLRALELDANKLPGSFAGLADHVGQLRDAGIEYGHELIELYQTPDGRARLTQRTGLSETELDCIVDIVDVARTGAPIPVAARLVDAGVRSGRAVATCQTSTLRKAFGGEGASPNEWAAHLQDNAEHLISES